MAAPRPSVTARSVATVRARLARQTLDGGDSDGAQRLLRAARIPLPLQWHPTLRRYLTARTKFFDDAVMNALERGTTQVVIVGAGYDDRALRFRTPGVRFIEVDQAATQNDKRRRIDSLRLDVAHVSYAPADLEDISIADVLDGLHDAHTPTLFLCEAVLPYVSRSESAMTLSALRACAATGSTLAVDVATMPQSFRGRASLRGLQFGARAAGEAIQTVLPPAEVVSFLAESGWSIVSEIDIGDLGVAALRGGTRFVRAQ